MPWTAGDAKNAAIRVFGHWKNAQPQSTKSREHAQILKRIADFIDVHGDSRFSDIDWVAGVDRWGNKEGEPSVRDRSGYWEENGGSRIFLFTSAGLKSATHGFDFGRVLRALDEADAFYQRRLTEKAKKRRTPDGRDSNLYHINPAKLDL